MEKNGTDFSANPVEACVKRSQEKVGEKKNEEVLRLQNLIMAQKRTAGGGRSFQ